MPRRAWTPEEDEYLLTAMRDRPGNTRTAYSAIAVRLGRSSASASCRYAELRTHGKVLP